MMTISDLIMVSGISWLPYPTILVWREPPVNKFKNLKQAMEMVQAKENSVDMTIK